MKEVFESFYLFAALQGVLLTVVVFTKKENHTANRILALATLCLSIDLVYAVYYSRGWYRILPHAMGFSYPFPFLYGPLFYLYAKLISKKGERFQKIDWLHFLPFVIVVALACPVYFYSGERKIEFINDMMHHIQPPMYAIFESIVPVQGLTYTFLTIKIVRDYDMRIRDAFSNIDLINLNWLKHITLAMVVIWSLVALMFIVRITTQVHSGIDALLQISFSILIYSIGYKGLQQPEIFLNPSTVSIEPRQSEKYKRSGLSDEFADDVKDKLKTVMASEKLYLDNDLTLQKLAERMNISSHNLSEVINSKLKLSYYDFINGHRVEEFKNRIVDPENEKYNMLSIAFDSGFKSKGTFNAIFKKFTGMTPSEYKSHIQSSTR
jgi:AraC-like DNA-binding protein